MVCQSEKFRSCKALPLGYGDPVIFAIDGMTCAGDVKSVGLVSQASGETDDTQFRVDTASFGKKKAAGR